MAVPVLSTALHHAFALAGEWHMADTRKGTDIPYISHLLAVTSLVLEDGGGEDEAIAALLHDAGEDAGGELVIARIEREFNPRVAEIVRGCSDSLRPKGAAKAPWPERKQAYLAHLREAAGRGDRGVLLVSAADKLHNARSILVDYLLVGEDLWDRFNARPVDVLWYHDAVLDIARSPLSGTRVVEQLELVMAELYRGAGLARAEAGGVPMRPPIDDSDEAPQSVHLLPLARCNEEKALAAIRDLRASHPAAVSIAEQLTTAIAARAAPEPVFQQHSRWCNTGGSWSAGIEPAQRAARAMYGLVPERLIGRDGTIDARMRGLLIEYRQRLGA